MNWPDAYIRVHLGSVVTKKQMQHPVIHWKCDDLSLLSRFKESCINVLLASFSEPWKRGIPSRGISFIFKHHPQAFIASLWQFNAPLGGLNCLRSTNTTSRWQTNAPMDNYLCCPLVYIVNLLRTGLLCLCSHSHRLYRLLLRVYRCTVNATLT